MRRQAIFDVTINGASISGVLFPILTSLTVSNQAGTHGDTAQLDLDDTGGLIAIPETGAKIQIALGWMGAGMVEVFAGTVDEVRSKGSRSGGMSLSLSAKGFDTTGKAKEGQDRHFDDKTVKEIITAAASDAGVTVEVDPQIAETIIDYIEMRGESLLHFGQRLARMVGASFRVKGEQAIMARRAGDYSPAITAARGVNLHSWDVSPVIGRAIYGKAEARYFDRQTGKVEAVQVSTGLKSDAVFLRRELCEDRAEAERMAQADAAVSKERSGGGSVTIEGEPTAMPDVLCLVVGARPGIDGGYRVKGVTHNITRGGGYTTTLDLAHPQGEG